MPRRQPSPATGTAADRKRASAIAGKSDTSKPDESILTKVEFATALVLCLVIVFLHFVVLRHAGGMWRDEINTIGVAQAPSLEVFWQLLRIATFPIPYFVLVRLWMEATGGGDAGLRVLVFLVGISIPLALWVNAGLLRPAPPRQGEAKEDGQSPIRSFPLISLAVFGLNADALWHGDMVRGYGLATIFLVLAVGFVWKLVVAPDRLTMAFATLAAVGTTQCLFQNAFFVLAICLGGAVVAARHRLWKRAGIILAVGGIAAAFMVPYVPLVMQSRDSHAVDAGSLVVRDALTVALRTLNSSGDLMAVVWGVLFMLAVGFGLAAQFPPVLRVSPERRDLAFYVVIALLLGVAGFFAFFFGMAKFAMAARYYTVPLAFVAVCFDGMVPVLPTTRWRRVLLLCLSVTIAVGSLPKVWTQCHMRHTNLDHLADRLEASADKNDLIVVMPCMHGTTFHRYYQGAASWITLPEIADFQIQRDDLWKAKLATTNAAASALEKMSQTLEAGHKVWFVGQPAFLPEGRRPPALPPAPYGPQGWFYGPYEQMWTMEAGYFLQNHTRRGSVVMKRANDVNPDENLPLLVFEGWRPSGAVSPATR